MTEADADAVQCPDFTIALDDSSYTPGTTFSQEPGYDTLVFDVSIASPPGDYTITYTLSITGQSHTVVKTFVIQIRNLCSTVITSQFDEANQGYWVSHADETMILDSAGVLTLDKVLTSDLT